MADPSDAPGYCDQSDVQAAMQETDDQMATTPLGDLNVDAAIHSASRWFARQSGGHFYDSNAASDDPVSTEPATAESIRLDVPSSPHPQRGQVFKSSKSLGASLRYPNARAGQYCRVSLPKRHVSSITKLEVRGFAGGVEDWVAGSETEGRGDDYYVQVDGNNSLGRSSLYINAASIGPRKNFDDLLYVDLEYGVDWQDTAWQDVRRGVAHLAAAELVVDDDIVSQIPDNGGIVNVETQAQQHVKAAMDRYLDRYLGRPVA